MQRRITEEAATKELLSTVQSGNSEMEVGLGQSLACLPVGPHKVLSSPPESLRALSFSWPPRLSLAGTAATVFRVYSTLLGLILYSISLVQLGSRSYTLCVTYSQQVQSIGFFFSSHCPDRKHFLGGKTLLKEFSPPVCLRSYFCSYAHVYIVGVIHVHLRSQ